MYGDADPLGPLLLLPLDLTQNVLLLHDAFCPFLQFLDGNRLSAVHQQALLEGAQNAEVHLAALLEQAQGVCRQRLDVALRNLLARVLPLLEIRVDILDLVDVLDNKLLQDNFVYFIVAQFPLRAHVVLVPACAFRLLAVVLHHALNRKLPVGFCTNVPHWNLV